MLQARLIEPVMEGMESVKKLPSTSQDILNLLIIFQITNNNSITNSVTITGRHALILMTKMKDLLRINARMLE